MALLYHHGGQAPLYPLQIPIASPPCKTTASFPAYPTATSVNSPVPLDVVSTSLAAPAPTDPAGDIFVLVTQEEDPLPSSTRPQKLPAPGLGTELSSSTPTDVSTAAEQMKAVKTKATIGLLSTLIAYVSLNSLYKTLHPEAFIWYDEDREEAKWIATSKYWLDRKACRWAGICGAAHFQFAAPVFGQRVEHDLKHTVDSGTKGQVWQNAWSEGKDRPQDWTDDRRVLGEIPDYVIEYAPVVHLFSGEQFWPCDIAEHLFHVTPTLNYTPLPSEWQSPSLRNLSGLNEFERGRHVFLTSNDNVEERPAWLEGEKNIPTPPPEGKSWEDLLGPHVDGRSYWNQLEKGDHTSEEWNKNDVHPSNDNSREGMSSADQDLLIPVKTPEGDELVSEVDYRERPIRADLRRRRSAIQSKKNVTGGRSGAPAVLVVVDKGDGIVDAFWFFFYSFNLGNVVFNVRFGNHVGDWEHTAIRFHHGVPKAIFFSEHNFGSAYSYTAVEKMGKRPVIYSATGTHAMYATPGIHAYVLPWGLLHDQTDRGPLWDPALNLHAFTYDHLNDTLLSTQLNPKSPTEWFHFNGHWGDKFYPLGDTRQYRFAGQYHYVNGPLGPKFKNLGRTHICPDGSVPCRIKNWLGGSSQIHLGKAPGKGEEMSAEDVQRFLVDGPADL